MREVALVLRIVLETEMRQSGKRREKWPWLCGPKKKKSGIKANISIFV